jgi:PGM1 C-terminal domain/ATP-grasp domain
MLNQQDTDYQFALLQQRFTKHYQEIFLNDLAEKTVIIIPSLTLDEEILKTIKGVAHYEERMLCMLMLLRMPNTKLIYISSVPIDHCIIDYYLHMLPGISSDDARQRLTLLSCYDASRKSLTEKILARPRMIRRILEHVKDPAMAHLSCFNVTNYEKELAVQLNIPLYGTDPALLYFGTKSGSRRLFKKVGIDTPAGFEDLKNEEEIIFALTELKKKNPSLKKAVIKMNDGFSGEGNAVFYYDTINGTDEYIANGIAENLRYRVKMVAQHVSYRQFIEKFESMGGIVEEFIDAEITASPSVQCRINPLSKTDIISTHDQLLGGEGGQVFLGAAFPAQKAYSKEVAMLSKLVTEALMKEGVLGRFGIDFLSVKKEEVWTHYAIEINLRKGGTTHPFLMLQFLTNGVYNWQEGVYKMPNGESRCYFATDNLANDKYKGLVPHDLIHIAISNGLLYDGAKQSGVMFHMIGALSQYGKLGVVCIAETVEEAKSFYYKTIEVLDKECMAS